MSRRLLLTVAGAGLVGACTSDADRINNLVFDAATNDPIYLWHPSWAAEISEMRFPLGRIYPEAAVRMRHSLQARDLPNTAVSDARSMALASGWRAAPDRSGYDRPIGNTGLRLWVTIDASPAINAVVMEFVGLNG